MLSPAIGLFLATIVRAEKYRWGYGRKWRPMCMPDSIIKLPVTESGKPDWAFMKRYIESLPFSTQIDTSEARVGSEIKERKNQRPVSRRS